MAKKKLNKSQAIRDHLADNPKAKPREVMEALGGKGIKVSYNQVYTVRSKGRKKPKIAALKAAGSKGGKTPFQIFSAMKDLAGEVGGMGELKKLVDVFVGQ